MKYLVTLDRVITAFHCICILDIYIKHNGCDIANQMFSNGQLWTWPLIFEICWTRLLSLVVYIWSYLWFSFQVCSTQAVYSFTKWTAWGLAPNEDNRSPGTGRLKRLEHRELMNTYRSWWRRGGIQTHFSDKYLEYFLWNSYQVNTTPHWLSLRCVTDNGGWFLWRFYSCTLLQ